jgi:LytS/YehU family sensor histidine kinase
MRDRENTSDRRFHFQPAFQWTARLTALILVTAAALGYALFERQNGSDWPWPSPPLPPDAIYWMVQFVLLPLGLVYLYGRTGLFRRALRGELLPRGRIAWLVAWTAIAMLIEGHNSWAARALGVLALLNVTVLVAGGLVGGWRLGLWLGLVGVLARGTGDFVRSPMDTEFAHFVQTLGLFEVVQQPWARELLWFYGNARVWIPLWAGAVSGLSADLLGARRYEPPIAFALSTGVILGSGGMMYVAGHPPDALGLALVVLVVGAATVAVTLMVHKVEVRLGQREFVGGRFWTWCTGALSRLAVPRWVVWVGVVLLVTLITLGAAWRFGQMLPEPLDARAELRRFEFNPYWVGIIVQRTVVPAILIYVYSTIPLFRRVISGKSRHRDKLKLFVGLAVVQLLTHTYELWFGRLVREPPLLSFLVVVVGGLVGGWKMAVGLGLITALARGVDTWLPFVGDELAFAFRENGPFGLLAFPWMPIFAGNPLVNAWLLLGLWKGVVVGLYAEVFKKHRFAPWAVVLLGVLMELGIGCFTLITREPPSFALLLPSMLVSALAMAVLALVVRNVQAENTRRRAEAAELALTRAELRALHAQINPHFLFNALNTIRYFVRTDPETARQLLLNLSEVFQRALRSGEFVPLRDELGYVDAYLSLEKARLGDRLRVERSIESEVFLDYAVPTLILQPLVENAVIHGIARNPGGGTVWITVNAVYDELVLCVEDDGTGIAPERLAEIQGEAAPADGAIGLRNVDGRLRALYGQDHRLVIESEVGRGTRVEIRIPLER